MVLPAHRRFRFGVHAASAPTASAWRELARRAEAAGYSTLVMPDHFGDQLAPVPALMAAADATANLRIGGLVWDNDYKHPVVLGKELATLDVLSDGRLEVGLGAGWMRSDYDAAGLPYEPAGVRLDRFEEALQVLDGVFSGEPFSFSGRHYTVTGYEGRPRPVQRPRPRLLIGGGGRRVLTLAARHADIVGINGTMSAGHVGPDALASMTARAVDEKVAIARAAAGERVDHIEWSVRAFFVEITHDRAAVAASLASAVGLEPAEVLATPFALIGTPRQIAEDLRVRRERWGFSYVLVGDEDVDAFAPVVAELAGT